MDLQLGLVLVIVATAAGYLLRRIWRTFTNRGSCAGCGPARPAQQASSFTPREALGLRLRRQLEDRGNGYPK